MGLLLIGERVFCTYFDSNYLPKADVMISTLRETGESSPMYALCFDDAAMERASEWQDRGVIAVTLEALEALFPMLATVRNSRSRAEYFFTCTPWWIKYVGVREPAARWVTYLDADLSFYSSVEPIFTQLATGHCGVIAHDYLPRYARLEKYGRYNVGWVSFDDSPEASKILDWWATSCLARCEDRPDNGHYADQGYLNQFADIAPGVVEISEPGANLAPWNLGHRAISMGADGQVTVNDRPLIFFHFHGLRKRGSRYVSSHLEFGARSNGAVRSGVYGPYLWRLENSSERLHVPANPGATRGRGWSAVLLRLKRSALDSLTIARGESFVPSDSSGSGTSRG